MTLTGKVAIVTGGSRGIGFAIASGFVAEGMHVTVTGRDERHLEAARSRLAAAGSGTLDAVRADVRSYADVERVVAGVVSARGGLDVLVNNAGVGIFAHVADMTPEQWSAIIDTNLTGVYYYCHAALPHLKARGGGSIINISSLAGTNAFVGAAAYCASKAGLNSFSEALMQEVRHDNVRVSYIMPGSVATGFAGDERKGADWKISGSDVAEVVIDLLRLPTRSLASRVELRPSRPPAK